MRISINDIYRAQERLGLPKELADSLVRKLLWDKLELTEQERLLLAAAMYIKCPHCFTVDVFRRASIRNPLRYPYGDVPGVDDASPEAKKLYRIIKHRILSARPGKPLKVNVQVIIPKEPQSKEAKEKPRQPKHQVERSIATPVGRRAHKFPANVIRLADYLWENIPRRLRARWKYIQVLNLARLIIKLSRETGVDPYSVDWAKELDWGLTYSELKDYISRRLGAKTALEPEEIKTYMEYLERTAAPVVELPEDEIQRLYEEFMMYAYAY